MKSLIGIALIAGLVSLAIIIGQRLSTDAMAVVVGVVFGVAASIPTSLLVVLAARGARRSPQPYRRDDYQPSPPAPQIYVVTPGTTIPGQSLTHPKALPQPPAIHTMPEPARRYKVVGESEYWLEEVEPGRWQ